MTDIVERLRGLVATCGCGACEDAADEIERLRAMLTKAYRFISPLSDPLPITNSEMANEIMRSLEQKAPLIHVGSDGEAHQGSRADCARCKQSAREE